jgi:hypothetical protein
LFPARSAQRHRVSWAEPEKASDLIEEVAGIKDQVMACLLAAARSRKALFGIDVQRVVFVRQLQLQRNPGGGNTDLFLAQFESDGKIDVFTRPAFGREPAKPFEEVSGGLGGVSEHRLL